MKIYFCVSLLMVIVTSESCFGETNSGETTRSVGQWIWVSGGGNEKYFTGSVGLRRDWYGLELGVASFGNMPKTENFDIPHNDYTIIGPRVGSKIGIDLLGFLPIDKQFSIYTGPGVYFNEEANIIQSNGTGWLYKKDNVLKVFAAGQVGINYSSESITIGIGYHSLRGATFQVGLMTGGSSSRSRVYKSSSGAVRSERQNEYSYRRLEELLASGSWKEADAETDKLILTVAKTVEEGRLSREEVENIPCRELKVIDELWLKYSRGRFGYSIQEAIYKSIKGSNAYNSEVWQVFGEMVGWKRDGFWVLYSDLDFSISAPMGHLPRGDDRGDCWLGTGIWCNPVSFVSRPTSCFRRDRT